jgi:GNAT superfamily N-acetyltransferase
MTMPPLGLTIQAEDPLSQDASLLIRELSDVLGTMYGDDGSGNFSPADVRVPRSAFVIARLDGGAIGCGAMRSLDKATAEIKRMYVVPAARRLGIGRRILEELERLAAGFEYHCIWLETGKSQPDAIALYEAAGYRRRPCYGIYVDDPRSLCYEKRIVL